MIRKGITTAVILLFIGLAVAPSINANAVDSDLIEVTTEFWGMDTEPYTLMLTQQEIDGIEERIKKRLEWLRGEEEES